MMDVKPGKIICVGLNYKSHAEETGGEPPKEPMLFSKFGDSITWDGEPVTLPPWHRCYDYEAELVIVMGKELWNAASPEEARAAIRGYTCGNDLSARDCQFRTSQWLTGKSMPGFAPIGPRIVPAGEFDPDKPHRIRCLVNGEVRQEDDVTNMLFSCAEIVRYCSSFFRLEPDDLIFTGTPAGVILGKPKGTRVWLKPGDTVTVEIEGIGGITNPLV
jgi:2-keto-4-pentenoate hydratase/2-oxohepta-3-ene-1,7-dioic acid hydratase in catechol pathway